MVLIGIVALAGVVAILHVLLRRWIRREMVRVVVRRSGAAAPPAVTQDPVEDADLQSERLRLLLDAIQ